MRLRGRHGKREPYDQERRVGAGDRIWSTMIARPVPVSAMSLIKSQAVCHFKAPLSYVLRVLADLRCRFRGGVRVEHVLMGQVAVRVVHGGRHVDLRRSGGGRAASSLSPRSCAADTTEMSPPMMASSPRSEPKP